MAIKHPEKHPYVKRGNLTHQHIQNLEHLRHYPQTHQCNFQNIYQFQTFLKKNDRM